MTMRYLQPYVRAAILTALVGFLAAFLASSERLLGLLNDILDFPRIEAGKEQVELAGAEPGRLPDWEGARILLVEDNTINQEIASELLRQAGYSVDVAEIRKLPGRAELPIQQRRSMETLNGLVDGLEIRMAELIRQLSRKLPAGSSSPSPPST